MSKFKNMKLRYKVGVGVASTAALVAAGGAAFAYFTDSGNGTGSATVGSSKNFVVTSSTAGGPMYPGTTTGDETVTVHIKNQGSGYQEVHTFTISVANSDGSAWTGPTTAYSTENGCSASDFALGTNTAAGSYTVDSTVDLNLPDDLAPNTSYTTTVNLHMLDTKVAQDNCQGLTNVPLYISAS